MKKINVICLVGPSGSGKTSIASFLETKYGYYESISHTSRDIRVNEKEGVHYFYLSREIMLKMCENNEFVEFVEFMGNLYAVHQDQLIKRGYKVVIVVEPGGANEILEWSKYQNNVNVTLVYLDISKEAQFNRMTSRGDNIDIVNSRINNETIREDSKSLKFDISINTEVISSEQTALMISSLKDMS